MIFLTADWSMYTLDLVHFLGESISLTVLQIPVPRPLPLFAAQRSYSPSFPDKGCISCGFFFQDDDDD